MSAAPVSVIIPAFRAGRTIATAIAGCMSQSNVEEAIVVVDGPDETSWPALGASQRLRVVSHPVWRGASACRNEGLSLARAPYVMFLDADDYLEGDLCASAAAAAERLDADIVFGRFSVERSGEKRADFTPRALYGDLDAESILRAWLLESYTPPCALVWRKSFVERIGRWDELLAKNQDGDLMYRALIANPRIASCDDGRGVYVQSDNADRISHQFSRRAVSSQFRVLEKIELAARRTHLRFRAGNSRALITISPGWLIPSPSTTSARRPSGARANSASSASPAPSLTRSRRVPWGCAANNA